MSHFIHGFIGSRPALCKMQTEKVATIHSGKYTLVSYIVNRSLLISFWLKDPSELTSAYYKTNFFSISIIHSILHSVTCNSNSNSNMTIIFLTQALGGSLGEPDSLLIRQLETLFSLFTFYHGSLERVRMVSSSLWVVTVTV